MRKFRISTPKSYNSKGEDKTFWLEVGSMIITDENKMFITLNQTPDITYLVSEIKPKAE